MRKTITVVVGLVAAIIGEILGYFFIAPGSGTDKTVYEFAGYAPLLGAIVAVVAAIAARRQSKS